MDTKNSQGLFDIAAIHQHKQVAGLLGLSSDESAAILGVSSSDLENLLRGESPIPGLVRVRLQLLSGVHKAMTAVYPDSSMAIQWLRARGAVPSNDLSPLEILCSAADNDAMQVLQYLLSLNSESTVHLKPPGQSKYPQQKLNS